MGSIALDFIKKKLYAVCLLVLVLAGINWGTVAVFNIDAVSSIFGKNTIPTRIFFVFVAICAIYVGTSRDSYLPFLGETVLPCSVLQEKVPDKADLKVRITAQAGRKVLYWASESSEAAEKLRTLNNWKEAYGKFDNAGVAVADDEGSALLHIRRPQVYWVPPGSKLEPHVHYRICADNGMMGPVRSLHIEERAEGFATAIHI
jgi:uncharacterized membrane protein YuzA (DUF378 family)